MNPLTEEALDQIVEKTPTTRRTDISPREVCAHMIYRGPDDKIGIPMQNLVSAFIQAGRKIQYQGKTNLSTIDSSLIPAFLTFMDDFCPFLDQEKAENDWEPDKRRGNNPGDTTKKVPVRIIRPKFSDWRIKIHIAVSIKEISLEKLIQLMQWAGRGVGVGDFRPGRKGNFGKFTLVDVVEIDEQRNLVNDDPLAHSIRKQTEISTKQNKTTKKPVRKEVKK